MQAHIADAIVCRGGTMVIFSTATFTFAES